jgi:hypothetical protein
MGINVVAAASQPKGQGEREYFELRQYHLLNRAKAGVFENFLHDVAIPAMNRIGIQPVGVFNVMYGPSQSTLYVLLVHKSLESVVEASARLLVDAQFAKADTVNAPLADKHIGFLPRGSVHWGSRRLPVGGSTRIADAQ